MKYRKHSHLKLSDLQLQPQTFLHVISMLDNHQPYLSIQKYVHRTLNTDILKSTISNLKHKVLLSRTLKVPITSLLDGRKNPRSVSNSKDKDRVTVLDCINALISNYYAEVQSQTLTNRQRQAFIEVLKMKLKYNNEIKDEVLDTHILTTALETDTLWKNTMAQLLWKQAEKCKNPSKVFQNSLRNIYQYVSTYKDTHALDIMRRFCKRHNIEWTDDIYYSKD